MRSIVLFLLVGFAFVPSTRADLAPSRPEDLEKVPVLGSGTLKAFDEKTITVEMNEMGTIVFPRSYIADIPDMRDTAPRPTGAPALTVGETVMLKIPGPEWTKLFKERLKTAQAEKKTDSVAEAPSAPRTAIPRPKEPEMEAYQPIKTREVDDRVLWVGLVAGLAGVGWMRRKK